MTYTVILHYPLDSEYGVETFTAVVEADNPEEAVKPAKQAAADFQAGGEYGSPEFFTMLYVFEGDLRPAICLKTEDMETP